MTWNERSIIWTINHEICCHQLLHALNFWSIVIQCCGNEHAATNYSLHRFRALQLIRKNFNCVKSKHCSLLRPSERWLCLECWHNSRKINFTLKIRPVRFRSIWARCNFTTDSSAKVVLCWSKVTTRTALLRHLEWDFHQSKRHRVVVPILDRSIHGADVRRQF